MVRQLLTTTNINIDSHDSYGRTAVWWDRKQGLIKIIDRLCNHANDLKLDILVSDIDMKDPVSFDAGTRYCDICLASMLQPY